MSRLGNSGLDVAVAALCARGRAEHPDLSIDDERIVAHLAQWGERLVERPEELEAADLYLACAALSGDGAAIEKLQRQCRSAIAGYVGGALSPGLDEIGQELWEALLVGRPGSPPKLASYSGRGPLPSFVGIAARRLAITDVRRREGQARTATRAAAEAGAVARDAELGFIQERYREAFQRAVEEALQALGDRERMIMRMYVVEGLALDRIAKVYGVSQSTISRWLAGARTQVLADARQALRARVPISDQEFDSMAGLMASRIDLSVSRILARADVDA